MGRIRINYRITTRVQVQRRVTYRQVTRILPVPTPPPRLVSSSPPKLTSSMVRTANSPLYSIRQAADDYAEQAGLPEAPAYDVFVAHASEDQEDFVQPLVLALQDQDLEVWYSRFVLKVGDSLRRSIDAGLAASSFGIVVLSKHFFAKEWPNRELDGLVTRSVVEDRQLILPVWRNVTQTDVAKFSPTLADKVALSTEKLSVAEIAAQIAEVVRE